MNLNIAQAFHSDTNIDINKDTNLDNKIDIFCSNLFVSFCAFFKRDIKDVNENEDESNYEYYDLGEYCNRIHKLNLQFFAEDQDSKTEEPSDYRKQKAREEGQVAKSVEINTAFLVIGLFFVLKITANYMYEGMQKNMMQVTSLISNPDVVFTMDYVPKFIAMNYGQMILIALPVLLAAMVLGVVANVIQVGWNPTSKALAPKFNRMNPIEGFKRIFSSKAFTELFKSLGKFALVSLIIYFGISSEIMSMINLINVRADAAMATIGGIVISLGIKVGLYFIIIALIDFILQKRELNKNLRMTKQEVKEEYKQLEGDPQIKQQRKQMHRQMSMKRMMQDVKTADVIITNPTHFAVAIKYDKDSGNPPKVVAKGQDYIAQKIKEIAREAKVEIVENKPLARTLYATVDVDQFIPEELYQAVAEVLAFVYKLKGEA